jgi:hypothetical protein
MVSQFIGRIHPFSPYPPLLLGRVVLRFTETGDRWWTADGCSKLYVRTGSRGTMPSKEDDVQNPSDERPRAFLMAPFPREGA